MGAPQQPETTRTILHSTVFHTLEDRVDHRWMARSEVPYPDRDALIDENNLLSAAMQRARDAEPKPLLVDLRRAVGRADPEFEQAMTIWRSMFLSGHPRLVILVATEAGQAHVQGHLKADGIEGDVVIGEDEALRRLLG